MDIDWQPVLDQVGVVIAGLVLAVIAWLGAKVRAYLDAQIASIKDGRVRQVVENFVLAAEQKYGPQLGEQKLSYVLAGLSRLGIKASREEIEALVYMLTPTQANGAATGASPFPTPEDIHEIAGVGD